MFEMSRLDEAIYANSVIVYYIVVLQQRPFCSSISIFRFHGL